MEVATYHRQRYRTTLPSVLLAMVMLVTTALASVVVAPAPPAYAQNGVCPTDICLPGWTGPGDGGSGPGRVGIPDEPPPPGTSNGSGPDGLPTAWEGCIGATAYCGRLARGNTWYPAQAPNWSTGNDVLGGGVWYFTTGSQRSVDPCRGRSSQWGPHIGVHWEMYGHPGNYTVDPITGGPLPEDKVRPGTIAYTCILAPAYYDTTMTCGWSIGFNVMGPFNNPNVASRTLVASTVRTAFSYNRTIANCQGSSLRDSVNLNVEDFGRYQGNATGTQVRCNVRVYTNVDPRTGRIPATQFLGCSAPYAISWNAVRFQVWCDGWSRDWSGSHSFDMNECKQPENPSGSWSCGNGWSGEPTVAGVRSGYVGTALTQTPGSSPGQERPIQTFADGEGVPIRWTAPNPRSSLGEIRIRNTGFSTRVDSISQPAPTGNASTNPFEVANSSSTWGRGQTMTSTARWYKGGLTQSGVDVPKSWYLVPTFWFNAEFPYRRVTVTGINFSTGQIFANTSIAWKLRENVYCDAEPGITQVFRARNSSGG